MELKLYICVIISCLSFTYSTTVIHEQSYEEMILNITKNPEYKLPLEQHLKDFQQHTQVTDFQFTCKVETVKNHTKATSVHELRPQDIGVVAAMGDSITAGNGAKATNIVMVLIQYRGVSWSVGGDETISSVHTLPNILRQFNPRLKGFSLNTGSVDTANAHLNRAVPGSKSHAMLQQAKDLTCRLHREPGVDFLSDWKVVTIFIGGNNLCDFCKAPKELTSERYVSDLKAALDYLHSNLPRTFVNLVQVLNVSVIQSINSRPICSLTHIFLCRCVVDQKSAPLVGRLMREYQQGLRDLVDSGRYDTRDDFTVVIQPFFVDSQPPLKAGSDEVDLSFFAPDCFHFSQKGHGIAAGALWNNMLQPVGSKQTQWNSQGLLCPTPDQYFATSKNSRHQQLQSVGGVGPVNSASPWVVATIVACAASVVILATAFVVIKYRRRDRSSQAENLSLLATTRRA